MNINNANKIIKPDTFHVNILFQGKCHKRNNGASNVLDLITAFIFCYIVISFLLLIIYGFEIRFVQDVMSDSLKKSLYGLDINDLEETLDGNVSNLGEALISDLQNNNKNVIIKEQIANDLKLRFIGIGDDYSSEAVSFLRLLMKQESYSDFRTAEIVSDFEMKNEKDNTIITPAYNHAWEKTENMIKINMGVMYDPIKNDLGQDIFVRKKVLARAEVRVPFPKYFLLEYAPGDIVNVNTDSGVFRKSRILISTTEIISGL